MTSNSGLGGDEELPLLMTATAWVKKLVLPCDLALNLTFLGFM